MQAAPRPRSRSARRKRPEPPARRLRRELENAVAALHAAARSLGDRERELTAAAHDQVVRCAIELAELIVVGELSDAGASAAVAARRALSGADPAEVREVRLHPDDLRTLRESAGDLAGIVLVADDTLDRGDAVAVLAHGRIDARVAGALERARHAVGGA